ncbi:hypothetical protein, partial [Pseudomonas syringae group genomosp. 7]|uniref:hypothetical protein n=1 Tax=Pseudomonas syringae group genomosp. 7 TaxID=251699 RepID=UPI00377076A8
MTNKHGTHRQRRAALFPKTPATATRLCPFSGPNVAIVPVRSALDRSPDHAAHDRLQTLLKA